MAELPEVNPAPPRGYDDYDFVAQFYDRVVPYRERRDIDFWVETARQSGGPVLEIGCGTGRVHTPPPGAVIEIVVLALSRRMLAMCREKLSQEPEDVRARVALLEADMRSF